MQLPHFVARVKAISGEHVQTATKTDLSLSRANQTWRHHWRTLRRLGVEPKVR